MQWEKIYAQLVADWEDQAAWTALAARVRARARSELWRLGQDAVEELVADTCAAVAVTFDRAHGPRTFGGFVLGQYLNARRQALRAAGRPTVSLEGVEVEVAAAAADEGLDPEQVRQLHAVLAELPPRQRAALLLRYAEELPPAGIAAQLRTSEGNARLLVHRGLGHLRRRLGPHRSETTWPPSSASAEVQSELDGRGAFAR